MSLRARGAINSLRDFMRGSSVGYSNRSVDIMLIGKKPYNIILEEDKSYTVRDLVIMVCKHERMCPQSVDLFALSCDQNGSHYLSPFREVDHTLTRRKLHFLLRFKVFDCDTLDDWDEESFKYYLKQCRHFFRQGKFAKALDSQVTEMLRMVLLEVVLVASDKEVRLQDILPRDTSDRKGKQKLEQFLNREVMIDIILSKNIKNKCDLTRSRKIVEESLERFKDVKRPGIDFLRELDIISKCAEERYKVRKAYGEKGHTFEEDFELVIHPSNGVKWYKLVDNKLLSVVKTQKFQDIFSMGYNSDQSGIDIQINLVPEAGIPEVLLCDSEQVAESICSVVDGYYRLLVNQYESLFKDAPLQDPGPFHGPITRHTAEQILKRTNEEGVFLVRECRKTFGDYVLSVFLSQQSIEHYQIKKTKEDNKLYIEENHKFCDLRSLLRFYQGQLGHKSIKLVRNLRPSETGRIPLVFFGQLQTPELKCTPLQKHLEIISLENLVHINTFPEVRYGETMECSILGNQDGRTLIVKKFTDKELDQSTFKQLALCHQSLEHVNIVRLEKIPFPDINNSVHFFGFEFIELGPLDQYVKEENDTIQYGTLLTFFLQVAKGMTYLTKTMNQVHGNLRARNLLVTKASGTLQVKISDSCFDVVLRKSGFLTDAHMEARCNWYAPEILEKMSEFTAKSDVWSYGMTLWEILAQQTPHGKTDIKTLLKSLKAGNRPSFLTLPYCSAILQALIENMWEKDPEQRPDFQSIFHAIETIKRKEESRRKSEPYYRRKEHLRQRDEFDRRFRATRMSVDSEQTSGDSYLVVDESEGSSTTLHRVDTMDLSLGIGFSEIKDSCSHTNFQEAEEVTTDGRDCSTVESPLLGPKSSDRLSDSARYETDISQDSVGSGKGRRMKRLFGNGRSGKSSKMAKHDRSSKHGGTKGEEEIMLSEIPSVDTRSPRATLNLDRKIIISSKVADTYSDPIDLRKLGSSKPRRKKVNERIKYEAIGNRSSGSTVPSSSGESCNSLNSEQEYDVAKFLASISQGKVPLQPSRVSLTKNVDTQLVDTSNTAIDSSTSANVEEIADMEVEEEDGGVSYVSTSDISDVVGPAFFSDGRLSTDSSAEKSTQLSPHSKEREIKSTLLSTIEGCNVTSIVEHKTSVASTSTESTANLGNVSLVSRSSIQKKDIKEAARKALQGPNAFNILANLPKDFLMRKEKPFTLQAQPSSEISRFVNNLLLPNTPEENVDPYKSLVEINNVSSLPHAVAGSIRPPPMEASQPIYHPTVSQKNTTQIVHLTADRQLVTEDSNSDCKTLEKDFQRLSANSPHSCSMDEKIGAVAKTSSNNNSITCQNGQKDHRCSPQNSIVGDSGVHPSGFQTLQRNLLDEKQSIVAAMSGQSAARPSSSSTGTLNSTVGRTTVLDPGQPVTQVYLHQFLACLLPQAKTPGLVPVAAGFANMTQGTPIQPAVVAPKLLQQQCQGAPDQTTTTKAAFAIIQSQPDKSQPVFVPSFSKATSSVGLVIPDLPGISSQNKTILPVTGFTSSGTTAPPGSKATQILPSKLTDSTLATHTRGEVGVPVRTVLSTPNLVKLNVKSPPAGTLFRRNSLVQTNVNSSHPNIAPKPTGNMQPIKSEVPYLSQVKVEDEDPYRKKPLTIQGLASASSEINEPILAAIDSRRDSRGDGRTDSSARTIQRTSAENTAGNERHLNSAQCSGTVSTSSDMVTVNSTLTSEDSESREILDVKKRLCAETHLAFFDNKDLSLEAIVGEGQYGRVYKGTCMVKGKKATPVPVAIKMLHDRGGKDGLKLLEEFQAEALTMGKLQHDNIVRLYGIHVSKKDGHYDLKLVTEWMPYKSLQNFIFRRREFMTNDIMMTFCVQIANGMEYLALNNIVHRDLATRNVLVASMEKVKICDFGLSRVFNDGQDYYKSKDKSADSRDELPIRWFAPESTTMGKFTSASDVWSFGVTIWEMFSLLETNECYVLPYDGVKNAELVEYLESGNRLQRPNRCPSEVWDVVLSCWGKDPKDRPTFVFLVFHLTNIVNDLFRASP